jgi:hypothetical protein
MNPKHFHTPISNRVRCPVCHQPVYSRGGIHPQCAMRQSEPFIPKVEPPSVAVPAPVPVVAKTAPLPIATVMAKVRREKPAVAAVGSGNPKHATLKRG